jgi:hypothetical protein
MQILKFKLGEIYKKIERMLNKIAKIVSLSLAADQSMIYKTNNIYLNYSKLYTNSYSLQNSVYTNEGYITFPRICDIAFVNDCLNLNQRVTQEV